LNAKITEELDKDNEVGTKALNLARDQHKGDFMKIIENINNQREQTKKTRGEMLEALRNWRKHDEELRGASKRIFKIEALIGLYQGKTSIDPSRADEIRDKKRAAEEQLSNGPVKNKELTALNQIEEKLAQTIQERDHLIHQNNRILTEILSLEEANIQQEIEVNEKNRALTESFDLLKKLQRNAQGSIYKALPKVPSAVKEYQELLHLEIERVQRKTLEIDPSLSKEEGGMIIEDQSIETLNQIDNLWAEKFENDIRLSELDNETNNLVTQREEAENAYKKSFGKMIDLALEVYEANGKLTFLSLRDNDEKSKELNLLYYEKDKSSQTRNKAFDGTMVHHHIVVKHFETRKNEEEALVNLCYELEKELESLVQAQKKLSIAQGKIKMSNLIKELILRAINPLQMKLDALDKTIKLVSK